MVENIQEQNRVIRSVTCCECVYVCMYVDKAMREEEGEECVLLKLYWFME